MKHFKKKLIILALISSGAMAGEGRASSMEDLEAAKAAVPGSSAPGPDYTAMAPGSMAKYAAPNTSSYLGGVPGSPVWDGDNGFTLRSKAESKGLILKSNLGREPFISNTSSPTQDGVVSTEEHAFAGFSMAYDGFANGAHMSAAFEYNDDDASVGEVDYSYSVAVGPGSCTFGVGYALSEDGDDTLMEEGFTGSIAFTTDSYGLSVAYNEGNGYDDQEKFGISFAVLDNLDVGLAYSETHGIGEYNIDVDVTSIGATYYTGRMALTVGYSLTNGTDTGLNDSVDHDALYVETSFYF